MSVFVHDGVWEESNGPYGYLILGLAWGWDKKDRLLRLHSAALAKIDVSYPALKDGA